MFARCHRHAKQKSARDREHRMVSLRVTAKLFCRLSTVVTSSIQISELISREREPAPGRGPCASDIDARAVQRSFKEDTEPFLSLCSDWWGRKTNTS